LKYDMNAVREVKKIDEYWSGKRNKYARYRCECGNEFICKAYQEPPQRTCATCRAHFTSQYPRLYGIYGAMKSRCNNPKNQAYARYGGRGIRVCDEWSRFNAFVFWALNNGYSDNLTIERIDHDGNYCPDNCTWIPMSEQALNTAHTFNNRYLTVGDETKTIEEWANEIGIKPQKLANRLLRGIPIERAVSSPVLKKEGCLITIDGVSKTVNEWLKTCNISRGTYQNRVATGMSKEDAIRDILANCDKIRKRKR